MRDSPNSRINAIKRFLSSAPPGSSRLRCLQTEQGNPIPIGEWDPTAVRNGAAELAEEIEQLLLDTAGEKRRHRLPFLLAWCDGDGNQKVCKEVTVYGHQLPRDDDTPEDLAHQLDGSTQSQLAQTQRHLEAMMRIHGHFESMMFSTMASTIDRLSERCAQIETSNSQKHTELLEAKETILGLLNEGPQNELTPAQLKAFELVDKYGPGLLLWLQSQAKNNAAKAANGKHGSNGESKVAA